MRILSTSVFTERSAPWLLAAFIALGAWCLPSTSLALVVYLSHSLAKKADKVKRLGVGFLPHLFVCGVFMLLLLKQPDLGTAVIMGGVTLILLFVAGTNLSYLLLALLAAMPILYHKIVDTPWRLRRILAYLDPWQFRCDHPMPGPLSARHPCRYHGQTPLSLGRQWSNLA